MALERKIQLTNMTLTPIEERRIEHRLDGLERRLLRGFCACGENEAAE